MTTTVQKSSSPLPIKDFSPSPQHMQGIWGGGGGGGNRRSRSLLGSPVPDIVEDWKLVAPNSPLLTAMREAVDSITQYEDFEIVGKIGAGFFAEVYKVRHIPTDQIMVLKLNKKMTGLKKLKEVELLKKLTHPNILHYFGACVHNGQLHPLTEFMDGGALEQLIQDLTQPLSMSLRLKLSLEIARGMDYLHCNGMLHRDLNSKNVLLRKRRGSYTAVVADFGLAAKAPSFMKRLSRSQSVVGNPYWMAPEVINGKPYDGKADVFSFGIILCELISRLEADPDELPRTRDYGVDEDNFRQLSSVVESDPPDTYIEVAFHCCQLLPVKRPDFPSLKSSLHDLLSSSQSSLPPDQQGSCLTLDPQPPKRLSFHSHHHHNDPHNVHHSTSTTTATTTSPAMHILPSKETAV